MDTVDTIEHKEYTINIIQDSFPENPRKDFEPMATIVCVHSRYNLGDREDCDTDTIKEIANDKDNLVLPLYLYDHSGITISTKPFSCRWDSGQVGIIYISYSDIEKNKITEKQAIEIMNGEVETYDNYLTGNVYGYEVIDKNDKDIDSCWGYYGNYNTSGLVDDAKSIIDCDIESCTNALNKIFTGNKTNANQY